MIALLKGKQIRQSPTSVVVLCGGVGYEIKISLFTSSALEGKEEIELYIHHHFSQDHQALYGFTTSEERSLFVLLISVSGVGPNTAQLILSYMNPDETRRAILGEDLAAFRKVKGVGDKTARRILLDLKDKVQKLGSEIEIGPANQSNRIGDEALSALVALGFQRVQAQRVLDKVQSSGEPKDSVEVLIRLALRELS
jgi:holliday junction DNA helicase RuvA